MRRNGVLFLMAAVIVAALAGCTMFSAEDRAVVDHRAALMRAVADQLNAADPLDPTDLAYLIECEARAAQNLSDAAHGKPATYPHPPLRPTSLPWTPVDAVPAEAEEEGQ